MVTGAIGEHRGGLAELGGADVSARRPVLVHYVLVGKSDEGLEVLRMPLEGRGEVLPVFSAGWAARGYMFAEAPGRGWYAKACTPDEMIFLLDGPGANVELVAFDPRPGRSGSEATNVMPRESFVDYLSSSRARLPLLAQNVETVPGKNLIDGSKVASRAAKRVAREA